MMLSCTLSMETRQHTLHTAVTARVIPAHEGGHALLHCYNVSGSNISKYLRVFQSIGSMRNPNETVLLLYADNFILET